jgi:hypothetical protein
MNRVTIDQHAEFLAGLMSEGDFDDVLEIDPFIPEVGNRRSQKEQDGVLAILDELEKGGSN